MLYESIAIDATKVTCSRRNDDGSPGEMPLYVARPTGTPGVNRPAVLLLQEIFGVNAHIQDVTRRFAAAGYVVVAPDLFFRQGAWQAYGYDQMAEGRTQVTALTEQSVLGDIEAALDFLGQQPDVDATRIGVVGYCFGGRLSLISAGVFADRMKAAAIYYGGGLGGPFQPTDAWPVDPLQRAASIRCPIAGFFGALDKHIPREHVERLDEALQKANVNHQIYYYPYADHGFFCDARATFHPRAAEDAWVRTMRFFGDHLGPVPATVWA